VTEGKPRVPRGNERVRLQTPVSVKPFGAAQSSKALMFDLSPTGCCLVSEARLVTGTQVLVRIPGLPYWAATVAWRRDEAVGIEFHKPLHPAVVEQYAGSFPAPEGPAGDGAEPS
jgi:hypothetical protein